MRIYGPNGAAVATAPATARRTAGGTFTVSDQEAPRSAAAAGGLRAISTVDALLALQGVEDFKERKKRAVAKGRNALDVLDQLKIGLIDGTVDQGMLARPGCFSDHIRRAHLLSNPGQHGPLHR